MKIIERKDPKDWVYTLVCKHCSSKLEASGDDVSLGDFGCGYGGDTDYQYFIRCPVCNNCNLLKNVRLPANVTDAAQLRSRRK